MDLQAQKITIKCKKASLFSVLKDIHHLTKINFVSDEDCMKYTRPVTLKADSISIKEILDRLCKDQPINFELRNNLIILSPKSVRGRVIDINGEPINDVLVSSTERTTYTNSEGYFILPQASCDDLITFSYKKNKQTVKVQGHTSFVVKMLSIPKSIMPFDSTTAFTPL